MPKFSAILPTPETAGDFEEMCLVAGESAALTAAITTGSGGGTDDGQRSGEGSGTTAAIGGFDTGRLKSPDHGHTEASEENVPAFRKK